MRADPLASIEELLWPQASPEADTQGFVGRKHDDLLVVLRSLIDSQADHRVRTQITQSLDDAGCDLVVMLMGADRKLGVQLKSHGDLCDDGFSKNTLAQIQDSRRHGLEKLYVVLAGDLTSNSHRQRVRIFASKVNQMNDPYVEVVPPERAWTLLGTGYMPRARSSIDAHFAHPYPLQADFTGRLAERKMLTEWLATGEHSTLALTGIGGMGKSALAWVWVQCDVLGLSLPGMAADDCADGDCRVPRDMALDGVFWWSFYESGASFSSFLSAALTYCSEGEIGPSDLESDYDRQLALAPLLRDRRLLIVLDGFERELRQYASLSAAYQSDQTDEGLPVGSRQCADPNTVRFMKALAGSPMKSRILMTSRLLPRELDDAALCVERPLKRMEDDDAYRLFRGRRIKGTRAEVLQACAPYGGHPLSLRLLASVILKDKRTPGDVRALERHPAVPATVREAHAHILTVAYEALDCVHRGILSSISVFRHAMPYEALLIFNPYDAEGEYDAALTELIDRGLLSFDRDSARYELHPVVRGHAYGRGRSPERAHARAIMYVVGQPQPCRAEHVGDLARNVELYHHTVRAGMYDSAWEVYFHGLSRPLYWRFGAYQLIVELLSELMDMEGGATRIGPDSEQAAFLSHIANAAAMLGYAKAALALRRRQETIQRALPEERSCAACLADQAHSLRALGRIAEAHAALARAEATVCAAQDRHTSASVAATRGLMFATIGDVERARQHLSRAGSEFGEDGSGAAGDITMVFLAEAEVCNGNPARAVDLLSAVQGRVDTWSKFPAADTRLRWVLGQAIVSLAGEDGACRDELLADAELRLRAALLSSRRHTVVDLEPHILLAWGRWHRVSGNADDAREHAHEALEISDRCEYRLCQADSHNFLAQLDLDSGDHEQATKHALAGYERAWCDGPPFCYRSALDEARRLLRALVTEPPDLPPYKGPLPDDPDFPIDPSEHVSPPRGSA